MNKKLPARIFLIGLMGAGKSYWGKKLAENLSYSFYDLDVEIECAENKTISKIFTENGEEYFRQKEQQLLKKLCLNEQLIIGCGGGTPCFFNNIDLMKSNGVVIWLNPSLEILSERLIYEKDLRPIIGNTSSREEIGTILKNLLEERISFYARANYEIKDDSPSIEIFKKYLYDL